MSRTLTVPVAFLIVILSVFSALIIASIFSALDPSILDGTTPSLLTYISMFVGQSFLIVPVLIYLNKNWKDSYGGHLELWNKNMLKCEKKISPTFNTMVIFSTTDFSNHGHPDPLNPPHIGGDSI